MRKQLYVMTNTSVNVRPFYFTANTLISILLIHNVTCVTHSGFWSPSDSNIKVIARFGFVKSDVHNHHRTDGYIFGNITRDSLELKQQTSYNESIDALNSNDASQTPTATVLLVDRNVLNKILGADTDPQRVNLMKLNTFTGNINCSLIFSSIIHVTNDDFIKCNSHTHNNAVNLTQQQQQQQNLNGTQSRYYNQFIRFIPCNPGDVCPGAPHQLSNQLTRSQLTYVIKDQKQPAFWYLLFIACRYNSSSCSWTQSINDTSLYKYKFKLVNGRPDLSSGNIFTYHFSYEDQDMILYIVMLALYVTVTIFQMFAIVKQRRRNLLVYLFTLSLVMHCSSYFLSTIHKVVFAQNGIGYKTLSIISDIIRITSLGLFIIFALIISKGWPMTRSTVTGKPLLLLAFLTYIIMELILIVWIKNSLDIVKEIDEYHTIAGWISLLYRTILMLWFLCELRSTMMIEQNQMRLRFYLHFGAGIMVWFVNLPIVTIIGLQISLLMRYKLIMGFSSAANVLAYVCVTHFMWPTKMSYHFLTHPMDADFSQEELEDYDHEITDSNSYYNNPSYTTSNGNNNHNTSHRNSNSNSSNKISRSRSKTRFSIDSASRSSNHVKT